jgi:hypothetical protein
MVPKQHIALFEHIGTILQCLVPGERIKSPLKNFAGRVGEFFGAALLYLGCELLVWGLSQAFRRSEVQFPASVIGMVLVFLFMCLLQSLWKGTSCVYDRWIKSKVDFINNHIGVGFPVPIIMASKGPILASQDIGRVIATFSRFPSCC